MGISLKIYKFEDLLEREDGWMPKGRIYIKSLYLYKIIIGCMILFRNTAKTRCLKNMPSG